METATPSEKGTEVVHEIDGMFFCVTVDHEYSAIRMFRNGAIAVIKSILFY